MAIFDDNSVGGIINKFDNTKTPTNGQVLKYNSTSGKWEPGTGGDATGSGVYAAAAGSFSASSIFVTSYPTSFTITAMGAKVGDIAVVSGAGNASWANPSSYAITQLGVCVGGVVTADNVLTISAVGIAVNSDGGATILPETPSSGYRKPINFSGTWAVFRPVP